MDRRRGEVRGPVVFSGINCLSLRGLIIFLGAVFRIHAAVESLPVVKCNEPIATTVAVDYPRHRYIPYYVKVHRCQGSWKQFSPNIKQCVANDYKEITIEAYSTVKNKLEAVIVLNHTSCGTACKGNPVESCNFRVQTLNQETCKCDCLFSDSPPPQHVMRRKDGFRWNNQRCRYECGRRKACSHKKQWDGEKCSCVCNKFYKSICDGKNKRMDSDTCECTKRKDRPVHDPRQKGFFSYVAATVLVVCLVLSVLINCLCGILNYRLKRTPQSMSPAVSKETGTSSDTACYESGV